MKMAKKWFNVDLNDLETSAAWITNILEKVKHFS